MASLGICRFFAGFFGTTPLSNAGGSIADMWQPDKRTLAFPFFGVSGFLGPCLGPVIGSYLTVSYLGWRWTNYMVAILAFAFSLACFFFMPETYCPIIMDLKAASIRQMTGDKRYISLVSPISSYSQILNHFLLYLQLGGLVRRRAHFHSLR